MRSYNFPNIKQFLIFLSLISINSIIAQENLIWQGIVIDSISHQTIKNVNITSQKSKIGTSTNHLGEFQIIIRDFPIELEFSSIGYKTKKLQLNHLSDTSSKIMLQAQSYDLEEAIIVSGEQTYLKELTPYTVLDYGFLGDSILVLQKKRSPGSKVSLVVLDLQFDTLIYKTDLPKGTKKLFKDCLNSYHLITKDSAYQLHFDHEIQIYPPYDIGWFNSLMSNCLFRFDRKLFFEYPILEGFGHEIHYLDEIDKQRFLFIKSVEREKYDQLNASFNVLSSYYYLHNVVFAATNDSAVRYHYRHYEHESRYIQDFEKKPIQNKACVFNNKIYYFNFQESSFLCFNKVSGSPTSKALHFDASKEIKWSIEQDITLRKLYLVSEKKAESKIYLIDTETGKLDYKTSLSDFDGHQLKINNGLLFYIKPASKSRNQVRKLAFVEI